jgi:hypothetical protein
LRRSALVRNYERFEAFSDGANPQELAMKKEGAKQKRFIPAGADGAPEEGNAADREKLSELKDGSDVLNERANAAKRAMDYADANAGDFEVD